jgi:hypothetical protein
MVGMMSFSNRRKPTYDLKKIYNPWRLASLGLAFGGLVTFLFALGLSDLNGPLMVLAVVILWVGVAVSYKYVKIEEGRPFEPVAKVSYFISLILALVLSVLTAITLLGG